MPYDEIQQAVIEGKPRLAAKLVQKALDRGENAPDILDNGLLSAMRRMGLNFQNDDQDIARVLACARAMKAGLERLEPYFEGGRLVITEKPYWAPPAEICTMWERTLWRLCSVGPASRWWIWAWTCPPGSSCRRYGENPDVKVVCISCLLTTSLPEMKHIVQALNEMSERRDFRVMVGGGPVTGEFARQIGADAYTENAHGCCGDCQDIFGNVQAQRRG